MFRYLPGDFTVLVARRSDILSRDRQNYPDDHVGWEAA
jgi:hypothetical protein